jgi:hypothetical protein
MAVRSFQFPGTITMFGFSRSEAAELMEVVEQTITATLATVSSVKFNRTNDKRILSRLGIRREGAPVDDLSYEKPPPSPQELETSLARWRDEKARREKGKWERFDGARRRENAEAARKRTGRRRES